MVVLIAAVLCQVGGDESGGPREKLREKAEEARKKLRELREKAKGQIEKLKEARDRLMENKGRSKKDRSEIVCQTVAKIGTGNKKGEIAAR